MRDDRDYKVELSGAASGESADQTAARQSAGRPYISVHFACCNIYLRIYRDPDGKAYRGHCPRCAKRVHFAVGHGGTDERFFRVE
jgi:hypothetical protein